jgi:hypothetical protein
MKTFRKALLFWTAAIMTTLNASASMAYDATTEITAVPQAMGDPKAVASASSNLVFEAYNDGFEVISLADTGLATTVSETAKKPAFVPEPSTIFAGALLLLPLVTSVTRALRKVRNG